MSISLENFNLWADHVTIIRLRYPNTFAWTFNGTRYTNTKMQIFITFCHLFTRALGFLS